jgi:hypothetical protein
MNLTTFKLLRGSDFIFVRKDNYELRMTNPYHSPNIFEIRVTVNTDDELYVRTYGMVMRDGAPYSRYVKEVEDIVWLRNECPLDNLTELGGVENNTENKFYGLINMIMKNINSWLARDLIYDTQV